VNEEIVDYMKAKAKEIFDTKTPLNFPVQLAVLRRR
jgi:hypothetical protein